MAERRLQLFDEFQYGPRSILRIGDRFRVTGGPIYVTDAGDQVPMYERGIFIFDRYCVRGAAKWIEAHRADRGGHVCLWVGKACWSNAVPNLRRRPYRVTRKLKGQRRAQRSKA